MTSVQLEKIDVRVFRVPIDKPVSTSFGVMTNRPAVFVRLTDADCAFGWGEIFANWPAAGAEHRARLLVEDMSDLVIGFQANDANALFHDLTRKTHIRALQCGEWSPFSQVIAGLDLALHDLFARRAGVPLAQFLNPNAARTVPAYASGIHIGRAPMDIPACRALGHSAFKVKIGFEMASDVAGLSAVMADLGTDEQLFCDANQAWSLSEAMAFLGQADGLGLGWLEEPIAADSPHADWSHLASHSNMPLAAGENITGFDGFRAATCGGHLDVIQPDVAKWGGVTGCYAVAKQAIAAGRRYCPHFLGGGVGLAASAHLLAAAGGQGVLEVDANQNPTRDCFFSQYPCIDGQFILSNDPGLGIGKMPKGILRYETLTLSCS